MLKISWRARLSNSTGAYFIRDLHRAEAVRLLAAGAITPDEIRGQTIVSFCMVESYRAPFDVQVGSFGIHEEHAPVNSQYGLSGGIIYSHQNTWEEVAA